MIDSRESAIAPIVPVNPKDLSELDRQVQGLIQGANPLSGDERRQRDRFPIPYSFRLVPLDADGEMLMDEMMEVMGKDLSLSGIGFTHNRPLRHRRAVISLDNPKCGRFAVEAEVIWTRPTGTGHLESGCRLVRTVDGHILRPKS